MWIVPVIFFMLFAAQARDKKDIVHKHQFSTNKFLRAGEKLVYDGSAPRLGILGRRIGKIYLDTKSDKLVSGKRCYRVDLRLELSEVLSSIYKYGALISSVLEYKKFRFLVYSKNDQKKDEGRFEKAIVDYVDKTIYYKRYRKGQKGATSEIKMDHDVLVDPLSLIYFFRALDFKGHSGQTFTFHIFNRGKILKVSIDYVRTQIEINKKKRTVIHIKPSKATRGALIRKRDVELYLDPETRIPLLIRILGIPIVGRLELELAESNSPALKLKREK